jgi:hypothetical protein
VARDLTIDGWADRPRLSAEIGEILGRAGVNIEGMFGSRRLGEIHVLVENPARARQALEEAGLDVGEEREVLIRNMKVVDQPGAWGRFARRLTDAGVTIEFHYLATDTRIVVGVDDYERAISALQVLGG